MILLQTFQLNKTRMTLSPRRNIFEMNLSLLTPFFPSLPVFSVHISFTFSSTILQWRSKALTRASSFRLFRHEMRTWVWVRVAVMRIDSGPEDSSCCSRSPTSYSLPMEVSNKFLWWCVHICRDQNRLRRGGFRIHDSICIKFSSL